MGKTNKQFLLKKNWMQLWVDQILFNDYEALMIRYVNMTNEGKFT